MKWINTLCFSAVIPLGVIYFDRHDLTMSIMLVATGIILGAGNHLFVRNVQLRKVGGELLSSYEKAQNDLLFDELTGLYSRRAGMERLREEFARSLRNRKLFSLAMVDVDHFKQVNDTYGHLAGDQVLKEIARSLKKEVRECDVVLRYGGEEFMVIMPETDRHQAIHPLQRLWKKFSNMVVSYDDLEIKVSVSIGVASMITGAEDMMTLINQADKALYNAKNSGRNRVVFGEPVPRLKVVSATNKKLFLACPAVGGLNPNFQENNHSFRN